VSVPATGSVNAGVETTLRGQESKNREKRIALEDGRSLVGSSGGTVPGSTPLGSVYYVRYIRGSAPARAFIFGQEKEKSVSLTPKRAASIGRCCLRDGNQAAPRQLGAR